MKRALIIVGLLLAILPARYLFLTKASSGVANDRIALHAAGRGNPWINLLDGTDLPTSYSGATHAKAILEQGKATPLAMTSADFDEDGVPDLVCGYFQAGGGILTIRRGNVDSIYPNSPEAKKRRASGEFTDSPFLSRANTAALAEPADYLGAGDFDADGHWDVLVATRGSNTLQLLPGDGRGGFATARQITVEGNVTALATGEINRADGLTDVAVGIISSDGAKLLVFEGPEGAMKSEPERFLLAAEVKALAMGQLDDEYTMDLAVGTGSELMIIHGRDRKLSLDESAREQVPPALINKQSFESPITSIAVGNFTDKRQKEIAVLLSDGKVEVRNQKTGLEKQEGKGRFLIPDNCGEGSRLVCAKVSSLPNDDLVLVDQGHHQIHILGSEKEKGSPKRVATSIDIEDEPVAVLPMRLNADALNDLVILMKGQQNLTVAMTSPMSSFVVNSTGDGNDCDPNDGICSTGTIDPNTGQCILTNECTLRAAIQQANASAGTDRISFSIGSGVQTITPLSALPTITSPLIIDGTTQPGFSGSPIIELNGAGGGATGLNITAGSSTVNGFVINRFNNGIGLQINGNNTIEGNYIGTDVNGVADLGNTYGVIVTGDTGSPANNTIGGTAAGSRNIISGNNLDGIYIIGGGAPGNIVQGNYIGTDVSGTVDLGNAQDGIVFTTPNNTIGGTAAGSRNIISGNTFNGVQIGGSSATGNQIQGNYIGTDVTGTADLGNGQYGVWQNTASNNSTIGGTSPGARNIISGNESSGIVIGNGATGHTVQGNYIGTDVSGAVDLGNTGAGIAIGSPNNAIGGTAAGARNIISGNNFYGVSIGGSAAAGNTVQGNFVGTDVTGSVDLGNSQYGVFITSSAANNMIGGTSSGARNIISGNDIHGILINTSATGNTVQGNYIGTDVSGTTDLGNTFDGVAIVVAPNNTIGGTAAGSRNLISGNNRYGVDISGSTASGNVVQGNYIGTDVTGASALGNSNHGVLITASAFNNTIGGSAGGNIIAFNSSRGVQIDSGTGNSIRGNSIHSNGSLGIDLAGNGVTGNDLGDGDTGANNLQNFPVVTSASGVGSTNILGTLNSTANTSFTVELFSNTTFDPSLYGEGQIFLGSTSATTDAGGNTNFNFTATPELPAGTYISATATRNTAPLDTSEFSRCILVGGGGGGGGGPACVTNTNDSGIGSLRQAISEADLHVGTDTICFNIAGAGPYTIALLSALPIIDDPVIIDGTSQPGFSGAPLIELNGTSAGAGVSGLTITAGASTVKGLVINRFGGNGIVLQTSGGNTIGGNYIGTNVAGTADFGNSLNGVLISSTPNNTIGGTTSAARNIISGNNIHGVLISGAGATGNFVHGNYLGTNATGTAAIGNSGHGVNIDTASSNTIGGATAASRNIISGNLQRGVGIFNGSNNSIQGNYIGTDVNGTADLGNSFDGVAIFSAAGNIVGGTTAGAGNVISGNNVNGVILNGSSAASNLVQGNLIGTNATGLTALGNTLDGVVINLAPNNTIGGTAVGAGNVIAFNGTRGVRVSGATATGNSIRGNSIFSNTGLGIDLNGDGVTANDAGDSDSGPNNLQNFPVLSSAALTTTNTLIQGSLNSTANSTFTIEFFSNLACDASGNGEGATFIGSASVATDGSGNASFNVTLAPLALGQRVTATTTDGGGNTSEFSACALVVCGYQISPNSAFFSVSGSEGGFNLAAAPGCSWTATSNDSWIELTSEASGSGSASITYIVRDNFSPVPRVGTITVAALTFTITQDSETAPDCTYNISPLFESYPANGGSGSINVGTDERCAWQAVSDASWITITSGCCAIGNGSVTYSVAGNPGPSGRAGTITIGGKTFNVKQKGN